MDFKKIELPFRTKKPILAMGSQIKNALCFMKRDYAYLSAVHSDLSNPEDFFNFEKTAKHFLKKMPKIIAHDLHPEYESTKYTLKLSAISYQLSAIQHHHAHITSCMAENGLNNQRVIGVAFDGTGLGSDNTLWGAEFLLCDYKGFQRRAYLKEIPLLGGERAILEPWRVAAAWLYSIYKDKFLSLDIDFCHEIDRDKWGILKNMRLSDFNSPLTSSMGRLFDATGSLVLGKYKVNFEAELAIKLEQMAARARYKSKAESYDFVIERCKDKYIIDPQLMFKQIVGALKTKEQKEKIAYQFHLTIARMIRRISLILRKESQINKVVLSGGVFQNNLLLTLSLDLLYKEGFEVFTHKNLSCNDSSLSLGQAAVANFRRN